VDDAFVSKLRQIAESQKLSDKISPLSVVIDTKRKDPRGQVSGNALILSSKIVSESESIKVFVHELGHIIDIYYLPQHEDGSDISDDFYTISWQDYNVKKQEAKLSNFVSGYALSNKYEDFAESFTFYVFHNDEFIRRAKNDSVLAKKYRFFQENIFEGTEFLSTNFATDKIKSYNWDATRIPVNVKKYLFYMK